MVSLYDSTESIDTDNVLLPLLERLGIRVPESLYEQDRAKCPDCETIKLLTDDDSEDEEVVYLVREHVSDENNQYEELDIQREDVCLYDIDDDSSVSTTQDAMASLTLKDCTNTEYHPSPMFMTKQLSHASFIRKRQNLTKGLYDRYNEIIFDKALPEGLDISWNSRLSSTAGLTHYKKDICRNAEGSVYTYSARIELSKKVLDSAEKLERTLIHEMCHCAAWLIDHVARPPHGEHFKKYAARAMLLVPHVDVSTCHNYDIFYPFRWQCTSCQYEYGRHSKSIDVTKKICGRCSGMLVFLGRFSRDGSPHKQRVSAYSVYVKENFSRVKKSLGSGTISASDVMKRIAEEWKVSQEATNEQRYDTVLQNYT